MTTWKTESLDITTTTGLLSTPLIDLGGYLTVEPSEAREIAGVLVKAADEAEGVGR